jgi:prolyl 4-hydroxylase
MVSVEDVNLVGGGFDFRDKIWAMANNIIQEWTGQLSFPTAVYGIRVYKEGSILTPHVDGLPRVSSMIVNVDQDVDEDWPLEVIGHDGKAYNVTMGPGDIVLYESHSIIHGRPFALRGKFFANIFIHFAPVETFDAGVAFPEDDLSGLFTSNNAREAALYGNLLLLKRIAQKKRSLLFKADENGWLPIHEAARNGSFEIIWYLVELGADINAVTGDHQTVLDVLIEFHGEHLPIVQKLLDLGAAASHHGDADASMDVSGGNKEYEHDEL